ncbi:hypothetical protein [Stratiformator vulcanicus]|uniref:Uncharacterized protein n=1 Tax=Stratiformator vulcanicus TaxID=2527980 RepID=A0A517R4G1_9PLAN|nr:hypothetical protein [Stratiformator vulcanicus]QDT38772.1 hypothetical protein Pan189_31700 [Stratiformator vulcanicus]
MTGEQSFFGRIPLCFAVLSVSVVACGDDSPAEPAPAKSLHQTFAPPRRLMPQAVADAKPISIDSQIGDTISNLPSSKTVANANQQSASEATLPGFAASLSQVLSIDSEQRRNNPPASTRLVGGKSDSHQRNIDDLVNVIREGDGDKATQAQALRGLPLERLDRRNRSRVDSVLRDVSMFRRLPLIEFEADPEVYRYFLEHPDVAVSVWRAMGVSKVRLTQVKDGVYRTDIGDGSVGDLELLFHSEADHLVLGTGQFSHPLLVKPIRATALFHLETGLMRNDEGKTVVRCRGSMFVSFASGAVETAAKLVSPVTNYVVDRNFREVALFVHMMNLAMQRQPGWVERIASRLDGVPEERKPELVKLTARVYVHEMQRKGDLSSYQELPVRTAVSEPR